MARVLSLTLRMLERQRLLERLSLIQRSIAHRAPLQEVLDAVTAGASELLGSEVAGLRLIDPTDPGHSVLVSASGIAPEPLESVRRTPMAAPVHEDGRVAGSLTVATRHSARRYSAIEQEALLALAEHASLALTDAKTLEAMREAQRTKDLFLAMVSHELKTPLTVIIGTLRTLEVHGGGLAAEVRAEMVRAGLGRARQLEGLINRLLQGARAELVGGRERVYLPNLVAEAILGFGVDRRVRVDAVPPAVVDVDSAAVREVLGIFMENAGSHSPEGTEIDLNVRVGPDEGVGSTPAPPAAGFDSRSTSRSTSSSCAGAGTEPTAPRIPARPSERAADTGRRDARPPGGKKGDSSGFRGSRSRRPLEKSVN